MDGGAPAVEQFSSAGYGASPTPRALPSSAAYLPVQVTYASYEDHPDAVLTVCIPLARHAAESAMIPRPPEPCRRHLDRGTGPGTLADLVRRASRRSRRQPARSRGSTPPLL